MALFGTPFEARDSIIVPAVYTGLDLRLYTNAGNSLGDTSTLGSLTYPTGAGYATITLNGTWSSTNGVVTYSHPGNPQFTATANWTGDVVGAAITDGTYILHFKDFALGPYTVLNGQTIEVDVSSLLS